MFKSDRGAALVGVIWVALLLGLLALGVMSVSLTSRKTPEALLARKQSEYLAESAITVFLQRYFVNAANEHVLSRSFELLGQQVSVTVELEDAKIGLNKANTHLLSAAIASHGYEQSLAESIADAIIDWRDKDDFITGNGAEAATYELENIPYGPRNGPFETLGELVYVRGMTPQMLRCLSNVFTVYSRPDIDDVELHYAVGDVLDVFSWAWVNSWHEQSWPELETLAPATGSLDLESRSITIRVTESGNENARFSKVVRIKTTTSEETTYVALTPLRKDASSSACGA